MPIYEYRCDRCAEEFEELLPEAASAAATCPHCGSREVTRRFSTFATEWQPSNVSWHRLPGSRARD